MSAERDLGILLGGMISEQSSIKSNLSGDDPEQQLLIGGSEAIVLSGELSVNKLVIGTSTFVVDHPVYGNIDSSVLVIDGDYDSVEYGWYTLSF